MRGSWGRKKSEKIPPIEEVWRPGWRPGWPPGTRTGTSPVRAGKGEERGEDYMASDTSSPGFVGSIVYGTCNVAPLLCIKLL